MCCLVTAESPVQVGVKPTNVIGSPEQHASFSFVRPGLTQTSFAFAGPSSHQSFAASIGNPQLAQKVQPSIAHALAQRNPGLGYYALGPAASGVTGVLPNFAPGPLTYQAQTVDPAIALTYGQQLQQPQQAYLQAYQPGAAIYQSQLGQLLGLRLAQLAQAQQGQLHAIPSEQVPEEQTHLQRQFVNQQQAERQSQNLLGVAYSSAPSVARVKVSGNGYKFDF
ncbi:PREDICTED: uncharacterized protein LOC105558708 isoform X2 [Vollenhovia emeryi]|uniref:uncharacterized protein LOC105558708 isoform X2 n=1 Tax=Vollenhovia emeryi TaxID=411798 RepID=UPI0005F51A1A|nr:PREDICTED: uncharacterized protein LOC105558708 isoform X2 [Vollenhovia emeryi]